MSFRYHSCSAMSKGNPQAKHTATCVGQTLFICWRNGGNKRIFFTKAKRKQGKAKFKGMMSLNECFIVLTVSSRKGIFLLAEKNKNKTMSREGPLLSTAALGFAR